MNIIKMSDEENIKPIKSQFTSSFFDQVEDDFANTSNSHSHESDKEENINETNENINKIPNKASKSFKFIVNTTDNNKFIIQSNESKNNIINDDREIGGKKKNFILEENFINYENNIGNLQTNLSTSNDTQITKSNINFQTKPKPKTNKMIKDNKEEVNDEVKDTFKSKENKEKINNKDLDQQVNLETEINNDFVKIKANIDRIRQDIISFKYQKKLISFLKSKFRESFALSFSVFVIYSLTITIPKYFLSKVFELSYSKAIQPLNNKITSTVSKTYKKSKDTLANMIIFSLKMWFLYCLFCFLSFISAIMTTIIIDKLFMTYPENTIKEINFDIFDRDTQYDFGYNEYKTYNREKNKKIRKMEYSIAIINNNLDKNDFIMNDEYKNDYGYCLDSLNKNNDVFDVNIINGFVSLNTDYEYSILVKFKLYKYQITNNEINNMNFHYEFIGESVEYEYKNKEVDNSLYSKYKAHEDNERSHNIKEKKFSETLKSDKSNLNITPDNTRNQRNISEMKSDNLFNDIDNINDELSCNINSNSICNKTLETDKENEIIDKEGKDQCIYYYGNKYCKIPVITDKDEEITKSKTIVEEKNNVEFKRKGKSKAKTKNKTRDKAKKSSKNKDSRNINLIQQGYKDNIKDYNENANYHIYRNDQNTQRIKNSNPFKEALTDIFHSATFNIFKDGSTDDKNKSL